MDFDEEDPFEPKEAELIRSELDWIVAHGHPRPKGHTQLMLIRRLEHFRLLTLPTTFRRGDYVAFGVSQIGRVVDLQLPSPYVVILNLETATSTSAPYFELKRIGPLEALARV